MNRISKVYYIITIILNVILLPIAGSGIPVYFGGNTDMPFSFAISVPAIVLALLIISIVGFKTNMRIRRSVLFKLTSFFFFSGVSFIGFDDGMYAFIIFECIAAILVIISIIEVKGRTDKNKSEVSLKMPNVFCYKGEWAWEDALDEYLRKTGKQCIDDLLDDETDMVYRYTVMPLVYYYYWLLKNGFMSEEYYELMDRDMIEGCLNGDTSPVDLLQDTDFVLHENDLLKGAADFTKYYFDSSCFTLNRKSFIFDYWDEIKNPDGYYYLNEFSWDRCYRLYDKIENAYQEWWPNKHNNTVWYEDDEPITSMYSKRFDKELDVYRVGIKMNDNISDDYIRKCKADIETIDEKQFERLDRWISDDYGDSLKGKVMSLFKAYSIHIYEPKETADVVYCISGEAEFEEEHGIAFYIRNGVIFAYDYGYDFYDIYDEEFQTEYEIASNDIDFISINSTEQTDVLVSEGKLLKTTLIPCDLGGSDETANMIYITPLALKQKKIMDEHLRGLSASWNSRLKFNYKAVYYDDKKQFIPQRIYVRQEQGAFSFEIKIWL